MVNRCLTLRIRGRDTPESKETLLPSVPSLVPIRVLRVMVRSRFIHDLNRVARIAPVVMVVIPRLIRWLPKFRFTRIRISIVRRIMPMMIGTASLFYLHVVNIKHAPVRRVMIKQV